MISDEKIITSEVFHSIQAGDTIVVSACLIGINCKYNGKNNANQRLMDWLKDKNYIAICPEELGGLATPRPPAEIVKGIVRTQDGRSVHEAFVKGAQTALEKVQDKNPKLFILQSRSPSCGVKEIYDGTFQGKLIKGKGVFAVLLEQQGYPVLDIEDFEGMDV